MRELFGELRHEATFDDEAAPPVVFDAPTMALDENPFKEKHMSMTQIPEGFVLNSKGHLVPKEAVRPIDRLQDEVIEAMMGHATALSDQIGRFKGHCMADVTGFLELIAQEYGTSRGGSKGNVTLTSFDGTKKVVFANHDHIDFGPELQIAKDLIDQCIAAWSLDSRPEIRALVGHAFDVDSAGKINRGALFSLQRLNIEDETWQRAMQAIRDSVRVIGSKSYVRFYRRTAHDAAWQAVPLGLASV